MNNLNSLLRYEMLSIGKYSLTVANILLALALLFLAQLVVFLLRKAIVRGTEEEQARRSSVFQLIRYGIWIISITASLEAIGISISLLLAGSAALLVGIGLGVQQIFNDLVSGLFLLYEGTIKTGDIMEVDGIVGKVQVIKLRTTLFLSRDGVNVIVPNHKFITESVINWSHNNSYKRFEVSIGVVYGSDTERVRDILVGCALSHSDVISDREDMRPFARLMKFADNALEFQLFFWSENIFMIEHTRSDIRFAIAKAFSANKISIPFPQRDVHLIPPPMTENVPTHL